jgi:hypothetical protein
MRADREHLVDDLLTDSDTAMLAAGHGILRRRRIVRRLRAGGLALAAAAMSGWLLLPRLPPTPEVALTPRAAPEHTRRAPIRLTDDQLLALFPGKPVALALVNGEKQLLFARPEDERLHVGLHRE